MATIIIYGSTHHGNTKKLVDAIAKMYGGKEVSIDGAEDLYASLPRSMDEDPGGLACCSWE